MVTGAKSRIGSRLSSAHSQLAHLQLIHVPGRFDVGMMLMIDKPVQGLGVDAGSHKQGLLHHGLAKAQTHEQGEVALQKGRSDRGGRGNRTTKKTLLVCGKVVCMGYGLEVVFHNQSPAGLGAGPRPTRFQT